MTVSNWRWLARKKLQTGKSGRREYGARHPSLDNVGSARQAKARALPLIQSPDDSRSSIDANLKWDLEFIIKARKALGVGLTLFYMAG